MRTSRHDRHAVRILGIAAALTLCATASAQLGKPTQEEITRSGNGPGPVPGGSPGNPLPASNGKPPSADPLDFAGTWRMVRGNPAGAARGGGAPVGPPTGPPAGQPVGPPGAAGVLVGGGQAAPASGVLPDRILCLPTAGTTVGVDGPMLLSQTPEQITWAAEEMHVVRRIFLKGGFTPDFKPNHLGEAIGHFEGNSLVVETRGLRSLPPGARMLERWTKGNHGATLEMQIRTVDAGGAQIGNARTQIVTWRPGDEVLEWMCEDYNDEWLPGGSDFKDQVGK